MYIARAFAQQAQLDEAIDRAKQILGPEVVRLSYELGEDWTGRSAIFFKIVLADPATRRDVLLKTTRQIESRLVEQIHPVEEWGVLAYFNYRSQSENAVMQETTWV